jgi:hypothetical protein
MEQHIEKLKSLVPELEGLYYAPTGFENVQNAFEKRMPQVLYLAEVFSHEAGFVRLQENQFLGIRMKHFAVSSEDNFSYNVQDAATGYLNFLVDVTAEFLLDSVRWQKYARSLFFNAFKLSFFATYNGHYKDALYRALNLAEQADIRGKQMNWGNVDLNSRFWLEVASQIDKSFLEGECENDVRFAWAKHCMLNDNWLKAQNELLVLRERFTFRPEYKDKYKALRVSFEYYKGVFLHGESGTLQHRDVSYSLAQLLNEMKGLKFHYFRYKVENYLAYVKKFQADEAELNALAESESDV